MLEILMALTQEGRALTAHLTTGYTNDDYKKLTMYLQKYRTCTDVQKLRAMVAKRPIGDKTPTEYLHALRLEFGTKPETLPLLKRIFEDSLAPHIAALPTTENLTDTHSYANRASELYVRHEPITQTTIAKIATSEVTFCNEELLQTLKALTTQVASLTTDINAIKVQDNQKYQNSFKVSPVTYQPQAPYRQPSQQHYQPRPQSYRQPTPAHFQPPAEFSPQTSTGPVWKSQPNASGQFSRPPHPQSSNWRSQPERG